MIRKLVLVAAVLLSTVAAASDYESSDMMKAGAIVDAYRELRKQCALSKGGERVQCFSDLKQLNAAYQSAKRALAQQSQGDTRSQEANLHVVSNVY